MVMALRNGRTNALDADTGAAEMTTLRIGKLIYCNTKIRHDMAICAKEKRAMSSCGTAAETVVHNV